MLPLRNSISALYVDRISRQWIVVDGDGKFWSVSAAVENAWDQRQPYCPTSESDLERVPTHYKQLIGLPAH